MQRHAWESKLFEMCLSSKVEKKLYIMIPITKLTRKHKGVKGYKKQTKVKTKLETSRQKLLREKN